MVRVDQCLRMNWFLNPPIRSHLKLLHHAFFYSYQSKFAHVASYWLPRGKAWRRDVISHLGLLTNHQEELLHLIAAYKGIKLNKHHREAQFWQHSSYPVLCKWPDAAERTQAQSKLD